MERNEFDRDKLILYWVDSSDDDFDTMIAMFEAKRFSWALFVGHLMIENYLKRFMQGQIMTIHHISITCCVLQKNVNWI